MKYITEEILKKGKSNLLDKEGRERLCGEWVYIDINREKERAGGRL